MASFIFTTYAKKIPLPKSVFASSGSGIKTTILQTGNGSITGRVTENGLPVSRRVMLYERKTGFLAAQTRSDEDGYYTFEKTDELAVYFVVSIDDDVQYNLTGQDLISGNHDARVTQ